MKRTLTQTAEFDSNGLPLKKYKGSTLTVAEAIEIEDFDALNLLFETGADFNNVKDEMHAIHLAASLNKVNVLRYFIEEKQIDINIPSSANASTTIHFAAESGSLEVLEYLMGIEKNVAIHNSHGTTPLNFAALTAHLYITESFFGKTRDVNVRNYWGQTPLINAISNGALEAAKFLLENNSDANARDYAGQTPLFYAIKNGDLETTKYLLENNADVDARDSSGKTPLFDAIRNGDLKAAKFLIENNADVNTRDSLGQTPLINAISNGALEAAKFLIENNSDANARDYAGQTPLFYAIKNGDLETTKYLLENNADVDARDSSGKTPLFDAIRNGDLKAAKFLIENNADVNTRDSLGQTPLINAISNGALEAAKFLIENNSDANARDYAGQTPLFYAVSEGDLAIIKYLLDNNANIDAKDFNNETPLFCAIKNEDLKTARLLLENNADVNARDSYGQTPLFYAIINRDPETAKFLLGNNADVDAKDFQARTPLYLAAYNKILRNLHNVNETPDQDLAIVKFLIKNGAKCNFELESGLYESVCKYINAGNFVQFLCSKDDFPLLVDTQEIKAILNEPDNKDKWLEFAKEAAKNYALKIGDFSFLLENVKNYHEILGNNFIHSLSQEIEKIITTEENIASLDSDLLFYTGEIPYSLSPSLCKELNRDVGDSDNAQEVLSFYENNPEYKVPGTYLKERAAISVTPELSLLSAMMLLYPEMYKCMSALSPDYTIFETRKVITKAMREYDNFKSLSIEEIKGLISKFSGYNKIIEIFDKSNPKSTLPENLLPINEISENSNTEATEDQDVPVIGDQDIPD